MLIPALAAGIGGVGRAEIDRELAQARLLEVELGLVGIVGVLLEIRRVVAVGRADRGVVADRAVAVQDFLHHLLAVDRELERLAHMNVVEGRQRGAHGIDVVERPGRFLDDDALAARQQVNRLEVDLVDGVDLARHQGVGASRRIGDGEQLDLVGMGGAFLPVVGVAHEVRAHTRIVGLELVAAAADAALPVETAVVGRREDGEGRLVEVEGEIGVAARQGEHQRVIIVDLDLLDGGDERLDRGLRVLGTVIVEGSDHVLGGQRTAVVELHAFTQLEGPLGCVVGGLPALRQAGHQLAVRRQLDQRIADGVGEDPLEAVLDDRRIVGVADRAVAHGQLHAAALLRRCGLHRLARQRRGQGRGDAERQAAPHEFAPGDLARGQTALQPNQLQIIDSLLHSLPP
jgi:hypothetical protein